MSIGTLEQTVEAAKRHVVQADDRNAVEVLQARAQRDELEEVWDDVDVDALATGLLDQAEHLHVLLERERDIQVIDALLPDDVAAFGERAEQRQSSIADVVARGPVVEKADDLEAELAVLEQLVRDEPAQIARAGNQHALEPDAGTPPALECLTHELARGVGEDDVDGQEQQPDRAGDLVDALRLRVEREMRRVVDLVVQRADEPEHDREDAAHEHGEEVIDARATPPEPVEPLDVKRQRHEHAEERQDVDVLSEGWLALRDGNDVGEPRLEPQQVGDDERRHPEQRVRDDVERDEQAVVPPHHGSSPLAAVAAETAA